MEPLTRNEIGLFDINFETGECYWSHEFREMLGVSTAIPAEFHLLLGQIHPDDRREFGRFAMEPFRPDCPPNSAREFRVVYSDGREQWLHIERRAILGGSEVTRLVGFAFAIGAPMRLQHAA
ncbi:MAG: hypothetical protein ABI992_03175 [Chthoniobacterales bacterium]